MYNVCLILGLPTKPSTKTLVEEERALVVLKILLSSMVHVECLMVICRLRRLSKLVRIECVCVCVCVLCVCVLSFYDCPLNLLLRHW